MKNLFITVLMIIILFGNCKKEKIKKMENKTSQENYSDYKKWENTSFLLLKKDEIEKIDLSDFDMILSELLDDINKKIEDSKFLKEKVAVKNFLLKIKTAKNTDYNDIQKVIFSYVVYKCDVLNKDIWFLYPRYFFSDSFVENYSYSSFFKENQNYKESSIECLKSNLLFFESVELKSIEKFIRINRYPKIYHSNDLSNLDPIFLKIAFLGVLDNRVLLVKIREKELKSILRIDSYFENDYSFENKLLETEIKYLDKYHILENIIHKGDLNYDD